METVDRARAGFVGVRALRARQVGRPPSVFARRQAGEPCGSVTVDEDLRERTLTQRTPLDAGHKVELGRETPLRLDCGATLGPFTMAYRTYGRLNEARTNAVLICHALTGDQQPLAPPHTARPGWWELMVGPGKPLDTDRYFVICVNSLGSCKGSTGPASINPATGEPWRLEFPPLSLEDVASAAWQVVRAHDIEQLDALVGPSMGGMTALGLLKQVPDCSRRLISISSASAATPFAISIRSLQREAIVSDPNWQNGCYTDDRWPVTTDTTAIPAGRFRACAWRASWA